jgi:inner membrane protein
MDPVSQAVVGAMAAQAVASRRLGRAAGVAGALGGVLPDADVLIRSASDPLLAVEMHRHFTHSLAFVPLGGLLAALPLLACAPLRAQWRWVLAACTLGWLTHGPLDALTSYGTLLFWPLCRTRVALDWMSIVDPLFTVPLLVLVLLAGWRRSARLAHMGVAFALAFVALGAWQHQRAWAVQSSLAASRGHAVEHGRVMPTVGNLVVWRSLYVAGGVMYADGVRVSPLGGVAVVLGESMPQVMRPPLSGTGDAALVAIIARDFKRFQWFTDGFCGLDPADATVIADMRYSLRTEGFDPLWGVRFHGDGRAVPVEWVARPVGARHGWGEFWQLLTGTSPRLRHWFLSWPEQGNWRRPWAASSLAEGIPQSVAHLSSTSPGPGSPTIVGDRGEPDCRRAGAT